MQFKTEFNIKSIIKWEVITERSFQTLDMSDEKDMLDIIYCSVTPDIPREIFDGAIGNKKLLREAIESVRSFLSSMPKNIESPERQDKISGDGDHVFIKDIVPALIAGNIISDRYAMYDMRLWELPIFIKQLELSKRECMESSRLWTWYSILPHIDPEKMPHPSDLVTFPWEEEEKQKNAREMLENMQDEFERFMSGDLVDFKKMGWGISEDN